MKEKTIERIRKFTEDRDWDQFHSPANLAKSIVVEKNHARNRARILAGYCWNWPKATRNNTNYHDIEIGDYSIS